MAWVNAYIFTVADSAVVGSLCAFTIYFAWHLKFYASILWASIFTILSYTILLFDHLAFHAKVVSKLPPSWTLARAFSHGFEASAFLLIVWAAYKIMSPALPRRIHRTTHLPAKVLWGLLIVPTIASTAVIFVYTAGITAATKDFTGSSISPIRTEVLARVIDFVDSCPVTINNADRARYASLALRASQFLAVVFLLTAYAHTQPARTPLPNALTKGERFSLSALTLPALLSGSLASFAHATAVVYIRSHPSNGDAFEMFSYIVYCISAMSKVVVLGAMALVIRSWVLANDAAIDEERNEKAEGRMGTAASGQSGMELVESR